MKLLKFSAKKQLLKVRVLGYRTVIVFVALVVAGFNFFYAWQPSQKAEALDTTKMLLFWDGGAAPTGWSIVTTYDGRFPRGDAPANVLQTGGNATHTITTTTNSMQYVAGSAANQTTGVTSNNNTHSHTYGSISGATAANNPAHRTLKLIQFDTGIPTSIPSGAIALFDTDPGASWTRQSAQDSLMLKIGSSVGTGGSDTHTHTITWPSLNASTGTNAPTGTGHNVSAAGHTHSAPTASPTSDTCSTSGCLPPYVQPLIYKANSTIAVPDELIALFDANPGGGWAVQSNSGGIFYQQFMRGASAFNGTSSGSLAHTHASLQSGNAGLCASCSLVSGTGGFPGSPVDHTHKITTNFTAGDNHEPEYVNFVIAKKSLPSMMLYWDGTDASIPAGWSKVTTLGVGSISNRYPRGEAPGNFGDQGGNATGHTHTNLSVANGLASATTGVGLAIGTNRASDTHTHSTPSVNTISTTSGNEPARRSLKIIKFDGGIPTDIPAGGITIFDNSPGIPTIEFSPGNPYWSRYAAQDNNMVKIDTTTTGDISGSAGTGSDTHTHTVTWSGSLGASAGQAQACTLFCGSGTAAATGHTHPAPGSTTSATGDSRPPYIGSLMAKANYDTPTLSTGITSMFTGDPGSGWVIQSSSGGKYYQKFIRPQATYSEAGGGAAHHTHTATGTSGTQSATGNSGTGANTVAAVHTHQVTATFNTGSSEAGYISDNNYYLPPYFNVIIAEKVDLSLEHYQWMENNDALNPTVKWSSLLTVPVSTPLPTLPTAYRPPDLNAELRLRVQIKVSNNALPISETAFILQWKQDSDATCTTGTWASVDVAGSGGIWRFTSSTNVTDGASLDTPASTYSKFTSPASDVMQLYSRSNPTAANPRSVGLGQNMEYDFHIMHNGAAGATQYSFRVIESGGTLLSEYNKCPSLVTKPQTGDQLRHGNFFESGSERGYSWVD